MSNRMQVKFLEGVARARFEAALPSLLRAQRWFGGKARDLAEAHIIDTIAIPSQDHDAVMLLIGVAYRDGGHETYVLPIVSASGQEADRVVHEMPRAVLAHLTADETEDRRPALLYDAMWDPAVMHALLGAIRDGARFAGEIGTLQASFTGAYAAMVPSDHQLSPRVLNAEQSNTSAAFGERALLKLYRRVHAGINPDWEIGRYLTSRAFPYSPAVGGAIEYVRSDEATTVVLLQAFVRNKGEAWGMMLHALEEFLVRALEDTHVDHEAGKDRSLWHLAQMPLPDADRRLIGPAVDAAARLGRCTAALHKTLGQENSDPDFAPEAVTLDYLQDRQESMVQSWKQVLRLLMQRSAQGTPMPKEAEDLLAQESKVLAVFRTVLDVQEGGQRIRCHGDYHLGQVLWTGADYAVIDFEGEPARPLHERRLKHSPLYDVAGMLRSFEYAACTVLARHQEKDPRRSCEPWTSYWSRWVRAHFLGAYLADVHDALFWPRSSQDAARLLTVHQLEKSVYELGYELNNRPEWVAIPLKGIKDMIRISGVRAAA